MSSTNGESYYLQRGMSGGEYRWIDGDGEHKYLTNMEKNRRKMELSGWDGPRAEFTYRFNSHGFRADEFSNDPSIMFLGCSMTMGVGMELENTWAHMVARDLGLKNHNLGIGGSSNDGCFRMFAHWYLRYPPKIVVHYSPPLERMEVLDVNGRINQFLPWHPRPRLELYNMWMSFHMNPKLNYQKNSLAIEKLCADAGIRYIALHHHQSFLIEEGFEYDENDWGRDLLHPGVMWHRNMHKRVMAQINC